MTKNVEIRTLTVEEIDAVQGGARAADPGPVAGMPHPPTSPGVVIAIIAILIG